MRAPSLHDLSLHDAIRASVARTPAKLAYVDARRRLAYAELPASDLMPPEGPEHAHAASGLTHRALMLRILELAVVTRAFSRDTVSAVAIAPDTEAGVVALYAPLVVGGTVMRDSRFDAANQAWIDLSALETFVPHASLRHVIFVGTPPVERLDAWLGAGRWSTF